MTQFGASRPTVREALRVLESNGIVRSRPGDPHGPEILPFSPHGLAKQMTRLTRVDQMSIADLVVVPDDPRRLGQPAGGPAALRDRAGRHGADASW